MNFRLQSACFDNPYPITAVYSIQCPNCYFLQVAWLLHHSGCQCFLNIMTLTNPTKKYIYFSACVRFSRQQQQSRPVRKYGLLSGAPVQPACLHQVNPVSEYVLSVWARNQGIEDGDKTVAYIIHQSQWSLCSACHYQSTVIVGRSSLLGTSKNTLSYKKRQLYANKQKAYTEKSCSEFNCQVPA